MNFIKRLFGFGEPKELSEDFIFNLNLCKGHLVACGREDFATRREYKEMSWAVRQGYVGYMKGYWGDVGFKITQKGEGFLQKLKDEKACVCGDKLC